MVGSTSSHGLEYIVPSHMVVHDTPKLDLDMYIQNYTGRTRFARLLHIGIYSVPLHVDALKAAVTEAKKGKDTGRYQEAVRLLRRDAPQEPEAHFDQTWFDNVNRTNTSNADRLGDQLMGYKHNLIKESIRMGLEELGRHRENMGDIEGALEMFNKMRQDVTTTKHIMDNGRLLTGIYVQKKDWVAAIASANKLSGQGDDDGTYQPWLKVVQGISFMGLSQYAAAANAFLHVESSPNPASPPSYTDVASPNDVAAYGGLLALATLDRNQLQKRVLDDQSFRKFLELEPHIRRAISMFISCRFSECLAILESYRADYLLDIYLTHHLPVIYRLIRRKCIVQYMRPFSRVTMKLLQEQFGQEGVSLERELASMIRAGELDARIDSVHQVVTPKIPDPQQEVMTKSLLTINNYHKEAREHIRRMSIVAAELEVRGMKKGSLGLPSFQNIHDKLIDPSMIEGDGNSN